MEWIKHTNTSSDHIYHSLRHCGFMHTDGEEIQTSSHVDGDKLGGIEHTQAQDDVLKGDQIHVEEKEMHRLMEIGTLGEWTKTSSHVDDENICGNEQTQAQDDVLDEGYKKRNLGHA
ncbi:hypothetical protein Fot_37450 [Forsythia ovata]|uniref:Uncharacterized protein n=1 Tax=Forsythia ovata TaxID=205694 RepID=A0ABD1RZL0_9LAMI